MAGAAGKLNRRTFLAATALAPFVPGCASPLRVPLPQSELAALEQRAGGRLGVFVLDTGSGRSFGHRHDERFGMCSTFKMALAGIVLRAGEAGQLDLEKRHAFTESDLKLSWESTKAKLQDGGMTALQLAETAQRTSDNGCANILLRLLGGPAGFTARLRETGDRITRLDRFEPELNLVLPGDVRDTTTPAAMAHTMRRFLVKKVLNDASRARLISWMEQTETGLKRIRAGLPTDWRSGDKTGTGITPKMVNKYNDIAIAWPPDRAPILIAAYYDGAGYFPEMRDEDQAVLAEVGRIAARWAAS